MSDVNAGLDNEEYEEITSDEVDRIVDALETLSETVSSENIRAILESAASDIWYLVYDDEDAAEAA
jgi:predicted ArsR family transcriptional regulator